MNFIRRRFEEKRPLIKRRYFLFGELVLLDLGYLTDHLAVVLLRHLLALRQMTTQVRLLPPLPFLGLKQNSKSE